MRPIPGSNLPLATLGTFVLWFGWFGFNGGSQLAMGSAADVVAIANIFVNTNIAAAAGVVVAIIATLLLYGKIDLTMALNGALGGLVSITAEPLAPTPELAAFIGAVGGLLVVLTVPLLDKLKIDDVVGAILYTLSAVSGAHWLSVSQAVQTLVSTQVLSPSVLLSQSLLPSHGLRWVQDGVVHPRKRKKVVSTFPSAALTPTRISAVSHDV